MNPKIPRLVFNKTIFQILVVLSFVTLLFWVTSEPSNPEPKHPPQLQAAKAKSETPDATKRRIAEGYGRFPLAFERNEGQTDGRVKFLSRGDGYTLFLTPKEAVLSVRRSKPGVKSKNGQKSPAKLNPPQHADNATVRMQFVNANPEPSIEGGDPQPGKSNYFIGKDPAKWQHDVPHYGRVQYRNVWPGVDVVYYGNQQNLEYDFVLSPGGDPSQIRMKVTGAAKLHLNDDGSLRMDIPGGELKGQPPVVYERTPYGRKLVAGRYRLLSESEVGFEVASHDGSKTLVIDPILSYSTYLGGSGNETGNGIAVDTSRNAYVVGTTTSVNFPTLNPFQSGFGGVADAFVTKINPSGALVYSTYLGGSGDDLGNAIAVDESGNAYITGGTTSPNFPVQPPFGSAFQSALLGTQNAFFTKLNPSGSSLVYSSYLGGNSTDQGNAIAVDSNTFVYIAGFTQSSNFPLSEGALQSAYGGGVSDAFVTKVDSSGIFLDYSTFLGGTGNDAAYGIAVDAAGNIYVTGQTASTNFPVQNPIQSTFAGGSFDAFVTKITLVSGVPPLIYSTYLGGSGQDQGFGIAVDSNQNAYVTGSTSSANFPLVSPLHSTFNASNSFDGFATKLNATGSTLSYSTYLQVGSASFEGFGSGIATDTAGNAYITGWAGNSSLPLVSPIQSTSGGLIDAFIVVLSSSGQQSTFSTYLGGSDTDAGLGIALDSNNNIYLTGRTSSVDFPVANAFQSQIGPLQSGFSRAFVAKILNTQATISATAGTPQSAAINTTFGTPLRATVIDGNDAPIPAVTVTFTAPGSGASGTFAGGGTTATAQTNGNGLATAPAFTANSNSGSYAVNATVPGIGTPATFSLTNTSGLQLTYACPAALTIGSAYSIPATVTGGIAPYSFSVISGFLPLGLGLSTNTGLITGTVLGSPSIYSFTIRVTDSGSSELQQTANYSCTLASILPPPATLQITSACPASPIAQNSSFTETLTATGGTGAYSWTISAGSLPGGLVLAGNTISGTVTGSPGVYSFSIQVSSGEQVVSMSCSLTVTPPKLQITSGCPGNGTQGVAYGPFTLSATGGLGASSYIFAISGSLPTGVTLSGNVISGTPQASGTFSFSIQVSSGTQKDSAGPCAVTIAPSALVITGTCPATAQTGVPISVPISTTGGKPPYTFSFSGSAGLGFSNGAVSGSIATAGPASFSVTVNDSVNSQPATFSCSFPVTASLQITGSCPANPVTPGVVFSLPLTGSGGTPPYGWSLSGPSWLSLSGTTGSSVSITGTPPATGSFPFSVTLTDKPGSPAATFSCTLKVISSLQITPSAGCPASSLQSTFSLSFTASGGTSPYSWAYSGPSWLALSSPGGVTTTLSGTAPGAGSFPFTVTLTDSVNSVPAIFTCTIVVIPNLSVTGSNPNQDPTISVGTGLALSSPAPVSLTGTVQLTFAPNATNPIDNPQVTFSDPCGRTCPFTIPAGQTAIPLPNVQPGLVAGTIHVEVTSLLDGSRNVLPASHPSLDLVVPRLAPVLTSGSLANQTSNGFDILLAGYSTPRDMNSVSITFIAAQGATINGGAQFTLDVASLFTNFYQSARSTAGGSTFTGLRIPITLSGDITAIGSVSIIMTNSAGQSAPLQLRR